jgi:hypothetical protein
MPMIDLGSPSPAPPDLLDGLPRRVALTLHELRYVAQQAGGAPLPFDVAAPSAVNPLDGRLGQTRGPTSETAYDTVLAELHDPVTSLGRRGLLVGDAHEGVVDEGLRGAVGLLATPEVALDIDVAVAGVHARSWQRQSAGAVASLSTVDGIVFELAWFPTAAWADELARVAVIPEDVVLGPSGVPHHLGLPFELADAAGEAMRTSRSDLVPALVAQHPGATTDVDGSPLDDSEVSSVLAALTSESRGRLRVLVADVTAAETSVVGVVSWTLLADGWRALRPHRVGDELHVEVRRVDPRDLAGDLAPVLAEVLSEVTS